ncbi:diaminopropionate ammonia-lyase family protein [Bombardia bombarda]|uniref:Diaminopropionate ammonia-lyase family protein n=1 Tax=Bombardia bombarda TaxID=252184 RepID=A0AA39XAD0_9PEZI|nr:diaminopropionate ammonia-lyase family protein [Bombardia bombarda]
MSSSVHINPEAGQWRWPDVNTSPTALLPLDGEAKVLAFHKQLPSYDRTPLHSLQSVANELALGHVLVKDESSRFGLPSFKILGASWAVYRAVAEKLGHATGSDGMRLSALGAEARSKGLKLVTCTEGNWGRAVARMAKYLDIPAVIYVPFNMLETARDLIRGEGAELLAVDGNYDDAVGAAKRRAEGTDNGRAAAVLVMDISWEGYETVPQYVVEGYQSMLDEADDQVFEATGGKYATHAIVPVGCGSIAQAVTQHFKGSWREKKGVPRAAVMAVEPTTAACLRTSVESGEMTTVATGDTIMCGMNCGTLSTTAWPVLRRGVDASVVVSDGQSHRAVQELETYGIEAGPCGAATLAALRSACEDESVRKALGLDAASVVVLCCTEGRREYDAPS